jgi:Leucine-rich repeat (LRR) protein
MSSNAGGTTHTDYQKMDMGVLDIYSDTTIDIAKVLKAEKAFISMYGLEQNTWRLPFETSTDLFRLYFSTSGAKTLTATVNSGHGMSYVDKSGEQVSNSYSRSVDAKDYVIVRATDATKITIIDWNIQTLSGGLSVSLFSKLIALTNFYCHINLLTGSIPSLTTNTALTIFYCNTNQFTGSIPNLTTNTALTNFYCGSNQLTGSIPSLTTNTALTNFSCSSNQLTGSIPSLTTNTALTNFYCHINQLTGSIPSLTTNTALTNFYCYNNQLTGSIPSLTTNTVLTIFYCYNNQLTGSIPSLTTNTALTNFSCSSNQLTSWTGGTVSATLGDFQAQNNLLTQATVDAILAAFVAAGRTTGTRILNLGGTGNATPSTTGLTDKATLQSRGWTVTTN